MAALQVQVQALASAHPLLVVPQHPALQQLWAEEEVSVLQALSVIPVKNPSVSVTTMQGNG